MAEAGGAPMYDLIELMFFAYRDFVGDADHLLAALGFGRAHHRVLHFVSRRPGLTIAELLEILKITKQSLNRVLKELLDQDYVEARRGTRTAATANCFQRRAESARARCCGLAVETVCFCLRRAAGRRPISAIAFLLAMVDESGGTRSPR